MTKYLKHKHYYILHYSYNDHGKTKKASIKVPSIDITDDKFVIIRNHYKHDITINRDKVNAVEEVTENCSFTIIAIAIVVLMLLNTFMF